MCSEQASTSSKKKALAAAADKKKTNLELFKEELKVWVAS